MDERFQYAEVRQRLIDALKTDLMGPQNVDEVLDENPMFAYIIGMLYPQTNTSADGVDVGAFSKQSCFVQKSKSKPSILSIVTET